jgi:predicted outer membrane protein
MNNAKHLLNLTAALSLALFALEAGASAPSKDRFGSNSLSDQPRGADSPNMIQVPPSGYPDSALSTSDSGGNGMAHRSRFDIYSNEDESYVPLARHHAHAASAPLMEHYYAVYGEDIPALRGLQLETAMNRLHHINREEIDMAKMAETRGKSAEFLNLAHVIRADHEALEKKVTTLAWRRSISLESFQLATYEKTVRDRLNKLSGTEFETAFLRVNEQTGEEADRSLRLVRNELTDTEVRGLINESLPRMAAHRILPSDKARARAEEGDLGE